MSRHKHRAWRPRWKIEALDRPIALGLPLRLRQPVWKDAGHP
jgi:hypothetical protein